MSKLFPRDPVVPCKREKIFGGLYWAVYLLGLPLLLTLLFRAFGADTEDPDALLLLNICFFALNFAAIMLIFWNFLCASFAPIRKFGWFMLAIAIAYGVYYVLSLNLSLAYQIFDLYPENLNQATVDSMLLQQPTLMCICLVVFAPITEECLCRGLLFGPICRRCPWLAYAVSSIVFALLHVLSGVGSVPLRDLLLSFVLYLPAGLALGYAYQKTRSIWGSIVLHSFINLMSVAAIFLLQFAEQFGIAV